MCRWAILLSQKCVQLGYFGESLVCVAGLNHKCIIISASSGVIQSSHECVCSWAILKRTCSWVTRLSEKCVQFGYSVELQVCVGELFC